MILDRQEFASMVAFMLPVIPKEEKTGRNCLFVKIEDGKYIFTGGGIHCVKRATIIAQETTVEAAEGRNKRKKLPESFMIPRGSLKGFAELLNDHKSICKKLAKNDEGYLYIEIDDEELESIGEYVHFKQPKFQYKDLQPFFEQKREGAHASILMSGEIEKAMAGFSKTNQVTADYCVMETSGNKANLIHFKQESTGYESVFICPPEDVAPEKEKGDNEQTEI